MIKTIEEVFSYNLKRLRGDLTQAEFAERAELVYRSYQRMEDGNIPQRPNLEAIAKVHGINETELFLDPDIAKTKSMSKAGMIDEAVELVKKAANMIQKLTPIQMEIVSKLSSLDEVESKGYLNSINAIIAKRSRRQKKVNKPGGVDTG